MKLSDIRKELPFEIQKNMYNGHLRDWKNNRYGYTFDFDVYLPTKNMNLQRDLVWNLQQKQELILSVIKGMDIQTFTVIIYTDKITKDKIFKIIDGKQRLTTLLSFMNNEFPVILLGDKYLFVDLPEDIKHCIEMLDMHFNQAYEYYDKLISDDDKINWFERLNYSGTPQEVEHLNKLKNKL